MSRMQPRRLFVTLLLLLAMTLPAAAAQYWAYFGTYTRESSQGIYAARFDDSTGALSEPRLVAEIENPSFLAIHPNQRFLYAVTETGDGTVTAFAIDPSSGDLRRLNTETTQGGAPCHLNVDSSGRMLVLANYSTGSVAAYPVRADGSLGPISSFAEHEGSSVNERRQKGPHAHSVNFSPDERFVVAADLGTDEVVVYRADAEKAALERAHAATVAPGSGPRHFVFHPSGRFAYVNNELLSTVTAFQYGAAAGRLEEFQTLSTLPGGFSGNNTTAEIRVHPNGSAVYVSNRGHNSIAVFRVDPRTGRLSHAGNVPTGGAVPRNFNLSPSGRFLLAANQQTGNVVVFQVDSETGALSPTGQQREISMPVCVRFAEAR